MTTYLGKSCSFGLPRVPFVHVNCRRFMYLVISLLVYRAGCGIWLYQFLIIAYLFTLCMLYRIHHSLVDIPTERYLQVGDSRTRGPAKFFQEKNTDTTYSNSFFPRTVRDWNRLSSTVVSAASLDEFRSLLWTWSAPLQDQIDNSVYSFNHCF